MYNYYTDQLTTCMNNTECNTSKIQACRTFVYKIFVDYLDLKSVYIFFIYDLNFSRP